MGSGGGGWKVVTGEGGDDEFLVGRGEEVEAPSLVGIQNLISISQNRS